MENFNEMKTELFVRIGRAKRTGEVLFTRDDWRLISVSVEVCHALEELFDSLNEGKNMTDDLIKRVREARKTGTLKLKKGDDSVIADALELYTALFEDGDTP